MERYEKSVESVVKEILEYLKRTRGRESSEFEMERETRQKILNMPELLSRLRNNPKILFNPLSGKYKFKPKFEISNKAELCDLLRTKPTVTIDQDLLDCYVGIAADLEALVLSRRVYAVRNADADKTIKCDLLKQKSGAAAGAGAGAAAGAGAGSGAGKAPKCSLYEKTRCSVCADNKGVVIMHRTRTEKEEGALAVKELWFNEGMPSLSELLAFHAAGAEATSKVTQTHLTTSSTQHMLTKSSIAKLKAAARQRKRTVDGKVKNLDPNSAISNQHVLEHLTN